MMAAQILSGTQFLEDEKVRLKDRISKLERPPGLGTILVGADPNSQSYVRRKIKACEDIGIVSHHFELDDQASQKDVLKMVNLLNLDKNVDAFIV